MSVSSWLFSMVTPLAKQALVAVGIGTVTYTGVTLALNQLIDSVRSSLGGLTGDVASIVAMGGGFMAMSIIAGALTSSVALATLKKLALRSS